MGLFEMDISSSTFGGKGRSLSTVDTKLTANALSLGTQGTCYLQDSCVREKRQFRTLSLTSKISARSTLFKSCAETMWNHPWVKTVSWVAEKLAKHFVRRVKRVSIRLQTEIWLQDFDTIIKLAHVPVVTFLQDGTILRDLCATTQIFSQERGHYHFSAFCDLKLRTEWSSIWALLAVRTGVSEVVHSGTTMD